MHVSMGRSFADERQHALDVFGAAFEHRLDRAIGPVA